MSYWKLGYSKLWGNTEINGTSKKDVRKNKFKNNLSDNSILTIVKLS